MAANGSKRGTGTGCHPRANMTNDGRERPVVLCDLDGVVWLARAPIAGSVEAIAHLRAAATGSCSSPTTPTRRWPTAKRALAAIGIPAGGDVLTSAQAAALLLEPGETRLRRRRAGHRRGARPRAAWRCATTVRSTRWSSASIASSTTTGWRGPRARSAPAPGSSAPTTTPPIRPPTVRSPAAARSWPPWRRQRRRAGGRRQAVRADGLAGGRRSSARPPPHAAVMVGDRPDTDGRFARAIGCRFALVYSGVTARARSPTRRPTCAVGRPPPRDRSRRSG